MTKLTPAERNSHQTGDQWTGKKRPSASDEERAREIADLWDTFDDDGLTNAIAATLERVRREERERCAAQIAYAGAALLQHSEKTDEEITEVAMANTGILLTALSQAIRSDGGNGDG